MNSLFDGDGKIIRFLNMFTDLCFLALLWVVCSIPVITIGASTTAYYAVTMKLIKGEESYIGRSFFEEFKENFKVSTLCWLLMGVIGIFLGISIFIVWTAGQVGSKMFLAMPFYLITFLIYLITNNFLFPYIAKFVDKPGRCLYISLVFGTRYIGYSLLVVIVDVAFIILAFFKLPILIILYPIISGFYHAHVYRHIFDKIIAKMKKDSEESDSFEKDN